MRRRGFLVNGQRLMELYQNRGWSQQQFADKTGLDVRTIAKVRRGGSCDASTLQRLAGALGIEPNELIDQGSNLANNAPTSDDAPAVSNSLESNLRIVQVWKIIDLRNSTNAHSDGVPSGTVWERYRFIKLNDQQTDIVFPYLTWGDGIECITKPDDAQWNRVPVEPGDIVHSDKQWELSTSTPDGPAGTQFEFGPVQLRFINAFHGPMQQWWQIRIAYEIESLIVQVLFDATLPCIKIDGTCALPGQRKSVPLQNNSPYLLPDGSLANWHITNPSIGAFYKLSWEWNA